MTSATEAKFDALGSVALVHLRNREHRKALRAGEEMIRIAPDRIDGHVYAGQAHAGLGDLDRALACHRRALAIEPSSGEVHFRLAGVYRQSKDYRRAEQHIRKALAENPRDAQTLYVHGLIREAAGDRLGALRIGDRILELEPGNAHGLFLRAMALPADNPRQLRSRLAAFERVLEADPLCPYTHSAIAGIHMLLGNPCRAEEHIRKAVELCPSDPDFRSGLDVVRVLGGRHPGRVPADAPRGGGAAERLVRTPLEITFGPVGAAAILGAVALAARVPEGNLPVAVLVAMVPAALLAQWALVGWALEMVLEVSVALGRLPRWGFRAGASWATLGLMFSHGLARFGFLRLYVAACGVWVALGFAAAQPALRWPVLGLAAAEFALFTACVSRWSAAAIGGGTRLGRECAARFACKFGSQCAVWVPVGWVLSAPYARWPAAALVAAFALLCVGCGWWLDRWLKGGMAGR